MITPSAEKDGKSHGGMYLTVHAEWCADTRRCGGNGTEQKDSGEKTGRAEQDRIGCV